VLERAHVLSVFLIGGMLVTDRLNFFVAFHKVWSSEESCVMYE
jgi:hypothetical protein